jgi:NAD(P)-dependent dehydrogenase (short-subunit alcohol dehydrogenase family)
MSSSSFFQEKLIVITGAGGSFGRVGCQYFLQQGCYVAALDVSETALATTVQECQDYGNRLATFTVDVTVADAVRAVVQDIVKKFGRGIDLLWNNAGYQGEIQPTLEYDPVDFDRVMKINVTGMFIVLQAVAQQMVLQQQEQAKDDSTTDTVHNNNRHHQYAIVNTASVAGLRGTPAMVAYASSKAAVLAMTVSTSKDLAPYQIRVNAISPALIGPSDGYMWQRQNELHAASGSPYFARDPTTVAQSKINSVPLKRLGTIEEVVQSVSFLLNGHQASYTTGTNLVIDGGMSSGLRC